MNQSTAPRRPLQEVIRPTTIIESPRLSRLLGIKLTIASETFQYAGSFKFRAAYNVVSQVPQSHIITASSGNFGQALAYACQLVGKTCLVVMPSTSAQVKINAVQEYGGRVDLVDVRLKSRNERVQELALEHPEAYIASPFDDPLVIQGNASLGVELCRLPYPLDFIVAPIGGGGLTSGIITGVEREGQRIKVIGAEPLLANDAARSLRAGHLISNATEPPTMADGARTVSLGQHNWAVLKTNLADIIEVTEENIKNSLRTLFSLANLKAEPTGALSLGAVLTRPEFFRDRSVCCVVSGGNVDPEVYRSLLAP